MTMKIRIRLKKKLLLGFLKPFVGREIRRTLVSKAKSIARVIDSKMEKYDSKDIATACLDLHSGKKSKSKSLNLGAGYFGGTFAIDSKRCLKMVKIDNQKDIDLFNQEVKMMRLAAAKAPGVGPGVFDSFPCLQEVSGELVGLIVMERIDGVDLREWLNKTRREGDKNENAKKVADKKISMVKERLEKAIGKLHAAGIFHHDLHEGNVIVTSKGDMPRIIDFGFASESMVIDYSVFFGQDKDRHRDYRILKRFDMNSNYNSFNNNEDKVTRLVLDKIMNLA